MKYHLDKPLKFWVDIELERAKNNNLKSNKKLLLASILLEFEAAGEAMRYLDAKGNITWKATPKMLENIADAELDAEDE
jgi:predicted negative regulator of RcsB-dependent stress response